MVISIHQTLEDRDNPDEIERDGPFKCSRPKAWLGEGYYFWDTNIELAHWWGKSAYDGKYVVCTSKSKINEDYWDLVGNVQHLIDFSEICNEFLTKVNKKKIDLTVPEIIEYLKKKKIFKYKAIRACGIDTLLKGKKLNDPYMNRIRFRGDNPAYLDLIPPIQICIIEKKNLLLSDYYIVHPNHYVNDGFI